MALHFLSRFRRNRAASNLSTTERNIRYLYIEITFASILGAIITFNSAFAVHLGATPTQNALLFSAPALLSALGSIPAARFMAHRRKRRLWLFGSLFLLRAGYLVVALMPLLFPFNTAWFLVLWIIALNLPTIFFTNGWTVLLGEIIPEDRRAFVISRRQILWSVGVVIVSWLAGQWLDKVKFPTNYEIMYAFGFVTVLGSQYNLNRLTFSEAQRQSISKSTSKDVTSDLIVPDEPVKMRAPIARLVFNTLVYQLGLSLPAALFNVYYIESLHTSDGWIGLNSAAASAGVVAGYFLWERFLRKRSYGWVQRRASLFTWIFPCTLAIFTDLNVIMLANFSVNVLHSGVDLSNFNVLLDIAEPHERGAYISWYNAALNASTFVAPLLGAWLAGYLGIPVTLLISGVLRLVGASCFNVLRIDDPAITTMRT
ncbi:MAG: MFS transporter [Chloroflexota bacterium]